MVFQRIKAYIAPSEEEAKLLESLASSRTQENRIVERARILLKYSRHEKPESIALSLRTNKQKVYRIVNRALTLGIEASLHDNPRSGKPRRIDDPARSYMIRIACTKPIDLGLSYELWTNRLLTSYIQEYSPPEYRLSNISNGTVSKILKRSRIRPHKITYYEEKIDPEFESKEREILHAYREVQIYRESGNNDLIAFLSYDEKPGLQALGNIYPDRNPTLEHGTVARNHDYIRHGTLSLLAGIDLVSGEVTHIVRERHRSAEFIEFLQTLDRKYPDSIQIVVILDNHGIHKSKETQDYLSTREGRFRFVFTPVHASWLNIIETMLSKMARSFLRGIRVDSKDALRSRIDQYFHEINKEPVEFVWKYKMDEMPGGMKTVNGNTS